MKFMWICLLIVHKSSGILNGTVDLGYGFGQDTIYWFGMPEFNLSDVVNTKDPYMLAKQFAAAEHGGTHLDAPIHFNPSGWTLDDIPLNRLIVSVDLGYGFGQDTIYWFGMPEFNLSDVVNTKDPYMLAKQFAAAEHGGTHLDAPIHFNPSGWTLDDIPLNRLIVSGVVIDKRAAAAENTDAELTVSDLEAWEQDNGKLPDHVVVICNFGWADKYSNKTAYFGILNGDENDIHFPGVSEGAAEWLVKSRKVVGVGVDTPSIDPGVNKEFIAHRVLTAANIYLMENLALAGVELPPRDFQLIVMPMKIINGTGAPLRILAQRLVSPGLSFFSRMQAWFFSIWATVMSVFN